MKPCFLMLGLLFCLSFTSISKANVPAPPRDECNEPTLKKGGDSCHDLDGRLGKCAKNNWGNLECVTDGGLGINDTASGCRSLAASPSILFSLVGGALLVFGIAHRRRQG